jgi:hypothetical protein
MSRATQRNPRHSISVCFSADGGETPPLQGARAPSLRTEKITGNYFIFPVFLTNFSFFDLSYPYF